jgi:hypothetical protein
MRMTMKELKKEQIAYLIIQWQTSLNTDGGVGMNSFKFAHGIDTKFNQI